MELSRIIGPPGTGKTTHVARQVGYALEAGRTPLLCSLTRAAAAEMAGRDLPIPREAIGTLHSHAYRCLRGGFADIADTPKMLAEWSKEYPAWAISDAYRDLDEDNAAPGNTLVCGDRAYQDYNCNRARMIPQNLWLRSETIEFASAWKTWKDANYLLDYTDLLENCLREVPRAPGDPDVIFADESQDFSALEMALLTKWGQEAGHLVVVGDPWQALYQWRGADPEVFYRGEANERVLTQSYRVPRSVHAAAIAWMQGMPDYHSIEYQPRDEVGECKAIPATWKTPTDALDVIVKHLDAGQTVMYLASCSYMLGPMIKLLRREGIPFHNLHRTKNGAWNPLRTRTQTVSSSQRLAAFLHLGEELAWTKEELGQWLSAAKASDILPSRMSWRKFSASQLANVDVDPLPYEICVTLVGAVAVEASMSADTEWYTLHLQAARRETAEFPCAIAHRYGRQGLLTEPRLTVGTIHSVKGAEADVVVLAPDLSVKGIESWHSGPMGRAEIYRLGYVGMTRAKSALHIMQPADPRRAMRLL